MRILGYLAPWSFGTSYRSLPQWNPLSYDSVGQFYVWRNYAGQVIRVGQLPLWNPYQFCGYPFAANSQSAIFYPGNILFYLLPASVAFGWTAALHLFLAAVFMYLLLRDYGLKAPACLVGSLVFAFSTWQVSWLQIPTFLCTACWMPLLFYTTRRLIIRPGAKTIAATGFTMGMMLLGGHLQIAFYEFLAIGLYLLVSLINRKGKGTQLILPAFFAALFLAFCLASPQILPSLELSRQSHRAGAPTAQGYAAYSSYAVNIDALATLFLPDFYGNPSSPDSPYFGVSRGGMYFNYAEGAMYVGVTALFMVFLSLSSRGERRKYKVFFGLLALLSCLMAMGAAVDALFYYCLPGFAQSGSPGRALFLWSFSMAILAAIGLQEWFDNPGLIIRSGWKAFSAAAMLAVVGFWPGMAFVYSMQQAAHNAGGELPRALHIPQQTALFCLSLLVLYGASRSQFLRKWSAIILVGIVFVDVVSNGMGYNPGSDKKDIFPLRSSIQFLQSHVGHDRILPINSDHFSFQGPNSILPPNCATYFELRDVQGYDSLFPGRYKQYLDRLNGKDSSPPEVGNMVFAKSTPLSIWKDSGVRWAISRHPEGVSGEVTLDGLYLSPIPGAKGRVWFDDSHAHAEWLEDGVNRVIMRVISPVSTGMMLADEDYPGWSCTVDGIPTIINPAETVFRRITVPAGEHIVRFIYKPAAVQIGLYLLLVGLLSGSFIMSFALVSNRKYPPK